MKQGSLRRSRTCRSAGSTRVARTLGEFAYEELKLGRFRSVGCRIFSPPRLPQPWVTGAAAGKKCWRVDWWKCRQGGPIDEPSPVRGAERLTGARWAQRDQGVLQERQRSGPVVTADCHRRACDAPCVTCPTPLRLVGPRTVARKGDWLRVFEVPVSFLSQPTKHEHDEPEDLRDPCPHAEPS
jgi:hypothetical protein